MGGGGAAGETSLMTILRILALLMTILRILALLMTILRMKAVLMTLPLMTDVSNYDATFDNNDNTEDECIGTTDK